MGVEASAKGLLEFESHEVAEGTLHSLLELEIGLETNSVQHVGRQLSLNVDHGFTNQGYLDFFEWLDTALVFAGKGHVDLWSEHCADGTLDRLHADGRREVTERTDAR